MGLDLDKPWGGNPGLGLFFKAPQGIVDAEEGGGGSPVLEVGVRGFNGAAGED